MYVHHYMHSYVYKHFVVMCMYACVTLCMNVQYVLLIDESLSTYVHICPDLQLSVIFMV